MTAKQSVCYSFKSQFKRGISIGFPDSSDGEESACNAGDQDSVPGSGRSPGEGNDSETNRCAIPLNHNTKEVFLHEYKIINNCTEKI